MKRKLQVEAMEERCLATAGLNPLPSLTPPLVNPANTQLVQVQLAAVLAGGTTQDPSVASMPHGGIHTNHNETLVRDTTRHGRARTTRRRPR